MAMKTAGVMVAAMWWAVAGYGQTGTGRISGVVQTSAGKPLGQARVLVSLMYAKGDTGFKPLLTGAVTAADGTFTVTGLGAGKYSVCPEMPSDAKLLPPCNWGAPPTVTLTAGQTVTMAAVQLKAGEDLYLKVLDPGGTRAGNEGKVPGLSLFTAVGSPTGMTIPIPRTGTSAAGFDHHLWVPGDTDLKLMVHGGGFTLKDEKGTAVDGKGIVQTIRIPTGKGQEQHTVTVTGLTGK